MDWCRKLFTWEENLLVDFQNFQNLISLTTCHEMWILKVHNSRIYTVKSAYDFQTLKDVWSIELSELEEKVLRKLWKGVAPPKVVCLLMAAYARQNSFRI